MYGKVYAHLKGDTFSCATHIQYTIQMYVYGLKTMQKRRENLDPLFCNLIEHMNLSNEIKWFLEAISYASNAVHIILQ